MIRRCGNSKPAVEQRRVDALARLAHGRVAAADDRERGQAAAQVDLDGDPPRGEAVDREGRDAGEHRPDARRASRDGTAPRVATILRRNVRRLCGAAKPRAISAQNRCESRAEHVTRRGLASPAWPPTSASTSAASASASRSSISSASATACVARNHRTRFGELDLIVCDDSVARLRRGQDAPRRRRRRVSAARRSRRASSARCAAWRPRGSSRRPTGRARASCASTSSPSPSTRDGRLVRLDHLEAAF